MMRLILALAFVAVSTAFPHDDFFVKRVAELARKYNETGFKIDEGQFITVGSENCGQRHTVPNNGHDERGARIVGGVESKPHSWPSLCSLRNNRGSNKWHMCGANLIKSKKEVYYMITAAHCVSYQGESEDPANPEDYIAYCGIHDRTGNPGFVARFSHIYKHPGYDSSLTNDIAVMTLKEQPPTTDRIDAICFPKYPKNPGEMGIVAGWGRNGDGYSPYTLHQVSKPIKPREVCEQRYGASSITDSMFCAGYTEGGMDSCQGDSGGAFATYDKTKDKWFVTGLVSWGYGCALEKLPGVYMNVFTAKEFVRNIIDVD